MESSISTMRSKPTCLTFPTRALSMYFLRKDANDVGSVGVSGLTDGQYSHFLSLKKSSFLPSPWTLSLKSTLPAPQ